MLQSRSRSEVFSRTPLRGLVVQLVGRSAAVFLAAGQCALSFGVMVYLQAWDAMVLNAVLLFLLITDLLPVNARWEPWRELTEDTAVVAFRGNVNLRLADDPQCAVLVSLVAGRLEYVGIRQPCALERSRVLDWWQQVTGSGSERTALRQPTEGADRDMGMLSLLGAYSDSGRWIRDNHVPVVRRPVAFARFVPDDTPNGQGQRVSDADEVPPGTGGPAPGNPLGNLAVQVYGTPQFHSMLHMALQLRDHSTGVSNADFCRETFPFHSHLLGELSSWYSDGEPDGREGNGFGGASVRPAAELLNVDATAETKHVVTYATGLALWQEPQLWKAWVVDHIAGNPD